MIGDDIVSDVGGAQRCGMRALQVRTGKYRSVHAAHAALHGAVVGYRCCIHLAAERRCARIS